MVRTNDISTGVAELGRITDGFTNGEIVAIAATVKYADGSIRYVPIGSAPDPFHGLKINEKSGISKVETEQAGVVFAEIAALANRADRLCYHAPKIFQIDDSDSFSNDDLEQVEMLVDQLRDFCTRIGVLADFGAGKTKGMIMKGGIEGWLLPPIYPSDTNALNA